MGNWLKEQAADLVVGFHALTRLIFIGAGLGFGFMLGIGLYGAVMKAL